MDKLINIKNAIVIMLKASRLYIDHDGDLLKVQSIKEVECELQDISKVYLLLDTNREYFVVEFNCIRTF